MTLSVKYMHCKEACCEFIYIDNADFSYCKHNHTTIYTIGFILAGEITLSLENIECEYQKNNFFLINPYTVHSLKTKMATSMLTVCLSKNFKPEEVERSLEVFIEQAMPQHEKQIKKYFPLKNICENLQQEVFIKNLPEQMYISKYHFIRTFKKNVGLTPHRFLIQNRLRKAQRLLESQESICNSAITSGFYDQSHFTKAFKELFNVTPSFYQKHCLIK